MELKALELTTIPEGDENSDEEQSVDYAQKELDNISREPHEFTHPVAAYQLLESQSNQEVEKTLGLFHSRTISLGMQKLLWPLLLLLQLWIMTLKKMTSLTMTLKKVKKKLTGLTMLTFQ